MLELDSVSKVYKVGTFASKELEAVSSVSFTVNAGEVVSLIGESGSGKSTIGKMILGLTAITDGSIRFKGAEVGSLSKTELKEYYRSVQGVFQDPFSSYNPIFKADRAFATLKQEFFPGLDQGEWEERVNGALQSVGLNPADCLNKFPHQLSGGQLQRILIARALLLDVDFLVADEIISMLDASTRIDVLNLLAELKATGLSILFITHDLSLGYYISEHTVILYRGRVVEMGHTKRVFENPTHPYTKDLMDSVAHLDRKWDDRGTAGDRSHWLLEERCDDDPDHPASPRLVPVEADHLVACHLVSDWKSIDPAV
jgi:peptide/nickel transport system ATP-binding protein